MKKFIIFASSLVATAASMQAASLVAGWDLSNIPAPTTGSIDSNWSDITNDLGSNGGIFWDGSNGSSNIPNAGFGGVSAENFNVPQNFTISTRTFNNQLASSPERSLGFFNSGSVNPSSQSFVIAAGTSASDLNLYDSVVLTYAGGLTNPGTAINIMWEYSLDGSNYVPAGVTSTIDTTYGAGGELETVTLDAGIVFNDGIYLRGTFGSIDSFAQINLDNFQVIGNAMVPEPSTYAMVSGIAILGIVLMRRRSKKA